MNTQLATNAPSAPDPCPECLARQEGWQIYTARLSDQRLLAWDVELAWKFCSDGRTPTRLHRALVDEILRINQFNPLHLDHVDPNRPGIACALEYIEDTAPVLLLIDGTHRAAVCRRDDRPQFVYMLTDEESRLCQSTLKVRLFHLMVQAQPRMRAQ